MWLWHRPAVAAPIQPLAWELLYAADVALKKTKKKKKKESALLQPKVTITPHSAWEMGNCRLPSPKVNLTSSRVITFQAIGPHDLTGIHLLIITIKQNIFIHICSTISWTTHRN